MAPDAVDFADPPEFERPSDFFAAPEAVRFPAAPLFGVAFFVAAVVLLAVVFLEADLELFVAVFDAPVADELPAFEARLFDDPPVAFEADPDLLREPADVDLELALLSAPDVFFPLDEDLVEDVVFFFDVVGI